MAKSTRSVSARALALAATVATAGVHMAGAAEAFHDVGNIAAMGDSAPRPNVVVVLIDDMGYADVGWHDQTMHTPEMESLAQTGVLLEQFYVQSTCTPSRSMLMTGRYNIRNGMQDSVVHSTEPRGVPLDEKFLSTKLQTAGYTTVAIGKWHLGMHQEAYLPLQRGFDYHYGIYTGGGSHTGHFSVSQTFTVRNEMEEVIWQGYNLWENGVVSEDNYGSTHSTHLYSGKAVEYLAKLDEEDDDKPFFMYVAYQAVHDPIEVGDEKYIMQTNCGNMSATNPDPDVNMANRKILCGMVAEIDDGVKSIRLQLEKLNEWDDTVLLVFSDNGGIVIHGSINRPLRGEKADYWEGGVRVPAFMAGGFIARAFERNGVTPYTSMQMTHITDIHASLLSVAGYSASSDDKDLDGIDHWSTWITHGTDAPRNEMLINLNSDLFAGSGAVRVGDYKLIVNPEPSESTIYAKVRKALAAQKGTVSKTDLSDILTKVHSDTIAKTKVYLFNVIKNPFERTDKECDDVEECHSLYLLDDFEDVRTSLEKKWAEYQQEMIPSNFKWEDDGPLADPSLFDGVWSAWRDGDNTPKAHYYGLSRLDEDTEASSSADAGPSSPAMSFASVFGSSSGAAGGSSSAAASSGSGALALFGTATALVVGAVGAVSYKLGQRAAFRQIDL
jgi:arylsulfatase A-like enzyme